MISVSEFYSALGVEGEVPEGDFVIIDEKVRVMAKSNEITLIFDSVNAGPQELKRIFEVSRTLGEAVPFTSKGGALGLKILCNAEEAQTITAVNQLESALSLVLTD
jgi:hypothetical protein